MSRTQTSPTADSSAITRGALPNLLVSRFTFHVSLTLLCLTRFGYAAAAPAPSPPPPSLDASIDRGLSFLQKQQKPDGSFDAAGPPAATAGLAVLAFLAAGHTPDVGKYGLTVRAALDFVLNQNPPDGYYGGADPKDGRMYTHCIVTIALAEAYGTELDENQRKRIRATLDKCLKVVYAAQDVKRAADAGPGGWRYSPTSTDADLSVTGWALLALRAAQNAGFAVPKDRVDRAMGYVLSCHRKPSGGFAYQPKNDDPTPAMTGVGLLNLHLADAAHRPEAAAAAKFLVDRPVRENTPYYYYSLYYTTQAAFQSGGATWQGVWRVNSEQLLGAQRKEDGSWPGRGGGEPSGDSRQGRFYPTAMATLTLAVPLRLLPLYQR